MTTLNIAGTPVGIDNDYLLVTFHGVGKGFCIFVKKVPK